LATSSSLNFQRNRSARVRSICSHQCNCSPGLQVTPVTLPTLAGADDTIAMRIFGVAIGIGSPTTGAPYRATAAGPQATPGSALKLILGPLRAAILRALCRPLTVSELAAAVFCAPSTATYHLQQLAAAGLICREKSGPCVWVSRSARGDELVSLLSDRP
jgi:DNA-binding transcriptional ArsR family regulator